MDNNLSQQLLTAIVAAPGLTFLLLATVWLLGWTPKERVVARLTAIVSLLMVIAAAWLSVRMVRGTAEVQASYGNWFRVGDYAFPLSLFVDALSLPLIVLTSVLIGIAGVFSVRYMHRERGFFRFFVLLHLFAFGALLALTADSFDLLLAGWELVGITSVLLVGFFDERREPVRNALWVFINYRLADLGLLLAIFVLHAASDSSQYSRLFRGSWPLQSTNMSPMMATLAGLLLLWGACGKSAQLPFNGWLLRAMEGPTPSSAIFYGAIAVHLGAYLLLRSSAVFALSPIASAAVVVIGALTAIMGTLSHRVVSDSKTSIAYAVMTQLGVIFVEIGLGFPKLALVHIVGHMVVRTLQFLRAPSALHDEHRVYAAAGGDIGKTGSQYAGIVPEGMQTWLYRFGLERGFTDAIVQRVIVRPALALSRGLGRLEPSHSARPAMSPELARLLDKHPSANLRRGSTD